MTDPHDKLLVRIIRATPANVLNESSVNTAIGDARLFIAVFRCQTSEAFRSPIAKAIAKTGVQVVSLWGMLARRFHDEVDRAALNVRQIGPITLWEDNETQDEFLWLSLVPYRGLLSDDANNEVFVLDVSEEGAPPIDLSQVMNRVPMTLEVLY